MGSSISDSGRGSPELSTLNLEHTGSFAPYAWLQGTPLLRKVWGSQHELWQGLMQWRASGEVPSPRTGVHGVRMTALGWFDFRSAWLRPEPGDQTEGDGGELES